MRAVRSWMLLATIASMALTAGCTSVETSTTTVEQRKTLLVDLSSLTPEEPSPAPPLPEGGYLVRKGDTLWSISRRAGVSLKDLLEANPDIKHTSDIDVGQVILIPKKTTTVRRPEPLTTSTGPPPTAEGKFQWPVRGRVLLRFGADRPDAPGFRSRGIDIRVSERQKIHAAKSGRATVAYSMPGFGKVVVLEHSDGTVTFYGYNSEILVASGATVHQGDAIALGGNSGRAVDPRLHFRILKGNRPVDPLKNLPQ